MNKIWLSAVIVLSLIGAPAWADTMYKIQTYGMNCPFCAYGIQKKIEALHGVKSARVDLATGMVTVRVTDGVTLQDQQMRKIVQSAGFTFRGMTVVPHS